MAQFDVHRNVGKSRDRIPFVVVVQSSQFDGYGRRVVAPLVRASELGALKLESFNPSFRIRGVQVVLHPLELVSIPRDHLGPVVGSLSDEGSRIVAALDELFSRAWK